MRLVPIRTSGTICVTDIWYNHYYVVLTCWTCLPRSRRAYPIQFNTEIYNNNTESDNFNTELTETTWNNLCLIRSEEAYFGTVTLAMPTK
jgi:hypothetical protein